MASKLEDSVLSMANLSDRAQCDEERDLVSEVALVLGQAREHLCGSLGVADVGNFLSISCGLDEVNDCGQIVGTHVEPGEVPELLLIVVRVVCSMRATVGVSTGVAKPHIVPSSGCDESWGDVGVVHHPAEA